MGSCGDWFTDPYKNEYLAGRDGYVFYSVVCQEWPKTSFIRLVGNMTLISRGASENSENFSLVKNWLNQEYIQYIFWKL